ncbi:MAG TPA: universal stress protein [Ilumatobacteraceae bacterium]|nr:universal stress protein [Ilumatobacteraceae bacterium]
MRTIERVAVPVNWTPESDRARVVASTLARWAGVGVELVTVAEPIMAATLKPRLIELARNATAPTTWRIVETGGTPEAALLTELARDENQLWCLGSHARGALGELLVGSLSEDFVRHAHVPVMLVGPEVDVAPTGRVLAVALDGTEQSESILPGAAELALSLGMTLRLLQVASIREHVPPDVSESAYLSHAAARVSHFERDAVDYDILHGEHPAADIADYVAAHAEVGVVALATRGLSGSGRLLHGSTAFDVAHRASIPVLILHKV